MPPRSTKLSERTSPAGTRSEHTVGNVEQDEGKKRIRSVAKYRFQMRGISTCGIFNFFYLKYCTSNFFNYRYPYSSCLLQNLLNSNWENISTTSCKVYNY